MKIVQASRKQLEPLMKEKQNFESHYEVRDISAKLHYLYTAEVETHTLGQMMARIQATQV